MTQEQGVPPLQEAENNLPEEGKYELRVLYFFGGEERRSGLRQALLDTLAISDCGLKLCMEEVDLIQEADLAISKSEAQKRYGHAVISGRWDAVNFCLPSGAFPVQLSLRIQTPGRCGMLPGRTVFRG